MYSPYFAERAVRPIFPGVETSSFVTLLRTYCAEVYAWPFHFMINPQFAKKTAALVGFLCRRSGSFRRSYASGASGDSRDHPNLADRRSLSSGSRGRSANTEQLEPDSKVEFFAVVSRSNYFQRVTLFARCDRVSLVWRNHPARRTGNVGGLVCSLPATQRKLIVAATARICSPK